MACDGDDDGDGDGDGDDGISRLNYYICYRIRDVSRRIYARDILGRYPRDHWDEHASRSSENGARKAGTERREKLVRQRDGDARSY